MNSGKYLYKSITTEKKAPVLKKVHKYIIYNI